MAFTHTFASLSKVVNDSADLSSYATKTEVTTSLSSYATTTSINNKLASSTEKSVTVTAENNTFTIDPNEATLFLVNVSANSTIAISSLEADYTSTGSVFSILLTLGSSSYIVTWPNNIIWSDGSAPGLPYKSLITFIKFDSNTDWIAGFTVLDDTFPSE